MAPEAGMDAFDGAGLSVVVPFYEEGALVAGVLAEGPAG